MIIEYEVVRMKRIKSFFKILGMLVLCASFTGCGVNGNIDDYAVNTGYGDSDTVKSSSGVSKAMYAFPFSNRTCTYFL